MGMTVSIDPELCTGHGRCVALCPDVFGFDDQGKGTILVESVADDHEDNVLDAVETCPEGAVSFVATGSGTR